MGQDWTISCMDFKADRDGSMHEMSL